VGLSPWFGNVILGVVDLAATAERLRTVGLDVQEGGTHPGFGTRNMVVPLGRSYLELLAVEDRAQAERSLFGRTLLARTADGARLVRWSIRTDRIDEVAADLGLEVEDRSRLHPDGRPLRWRSAGMTPSLLDPCRPFFVQWPDADWPGAEPARPTAAVGDITGLEVTVPDRDAVREWTLGLDLPLTVRDGPSDLTVVTVEVDGRPWRLGIEGRR
jgi:hypothetical protein